MACPANAILVGQPQAASLDIAMLLICFPLSWQRPTHLPVMPNLPPLSCRSHVLWGGLRVLSCQSRRLRNALAGCSLIVALAGCQFHRTGHGFVLRSQWSLECDHCRPRLTFGPQKGTEQPQLADQTAGKGDRHLLPERPEGCCTQKGTGTFSGRTAAQPEVLPWRSRLKGYRLAARIFGRNGPGGSGRADSGPSPKPGLATSPPPLPPPPDEPGDGQPVSPSEGPGGLQLPGNTPLAPEPRPSTLTVD